MASTIKIKNSSTAGAVPTSSDLVQGELAINVTDRRIFTENASGTVVELGTPSIDDNGNATAITIDSSGNVGIGTSSTASAKLTVSNGGANATISLNGGTGTTASPVFTSFQFRGYNANRTAVIQSYDQSSTNVISGGLLFYTNADMTADVPTERMRIDGSGNVLVTSAAKLGYGTGSGGTVTQATSKSTTVTLNKPTGSITMNNAALAAATSVWFQLNNSLAAVGDTVIANMTNEGVADPSAYDLDVLIGAGAIYFSVRNKTAASRSEAIVINFSIIKGSRA